MGVGAEFTSWGGAGGVSAFKALVLELSYFRLRELLELIDFFYNFVFTVAVSSVVVCLFRVTELFNSVDRPLRVFS